MPGFEITPFSLISTLCFILAILHTFSVHQFQKMGNRFPQGSVPENLFHLLGEVEVVFGVWAAVFLILATFVEGFKPVEAYLNTRNFTEPLFIFVVMTICASSPILLFAEKIILAIADRLPLPKSIAVYVSALVLGPLLGSFITEPAAMTVTAFFLLQHFYEKKISDKLKFATLGLLFVNISIGGTLTPYAAPPVLMVAKTWGWNLEFMLQHFGWKSVLAILLSTALVVWQNRQELAGLPMTSPPSSQKSTPSWVIALHLLFLIAAVIFAHFPVFFIGIFLFFLGIVAVTEEYQSPLKLKESLLVAFFLSGLILLGGPQKWWLQPLISEMNSTLLYFGGILLTSITDNAALTYLGSLVENLSDLSKYSLVAGSIVGGGLTVIANAPNPAGYSILNKSFPDGSISPYQLFIAALMPTTLAAICFYLL